MSSGDHPETRARILEATLSLLEAHRGRGVRMADIARSAGISRQAVYLHFESRADLLEAATKHLDQRLGLDRQLRATRESRSGLERLRRYIDFWGGYLPQIYGVAKALLLAMDTDEAAAAAWNDRLRAMREGCRAVIDALHTDGALRPEWTPGRATDMLWTLLSVGNWEHLTQDCGWSTRQYIRRMQELAERAFVRDRVLG